MLRHHCFTAPPSFPQANLNLLLTKKFFKYKFRPRIQQSIIIFITTSDYDYSESTPGAKNISNSRCFTWLTLSNERKLLITLRWREGSEFNNFKISHTWQRYCSHYKLSASKYRPWWWPMHKFLIDHALEVSVMPEHVLRCFSISRIGGVTLDSIECVCSVAQACTILCYPLDHSLPGSSVNGIFSVKNTGMGCHFFFQGIFPTQRSNPVSCISCIWRQIFWIGMFSLCTSYSTYLHILSAIVIDKFVILNISVQTLSSSNQVFTIIAWMVVAIEYPVQHCRF